MKIVIIVGLVLASVAAVSSGIAAWNTTPSKQRAHIQEAATSTPLVSLKQIER